MRHTRTDASAELFPTLEEASILLNAAKFMDAFSFSDDGSQQIVIVGTGALGSLVAKAARAANLDVCAAADNDERIWQSDFAGVPILPPREAVARFGETTIFIVAIFNPSAVIKQLQSYGCKRVVTYPVFYWNFSEYIEGITGLARPNMLLDHRIEIEAAYEVLADEASRAEFSAQVAWRCTLDDVNLPKPSSARDMHFDGSIYNLREDETLVDCGAFDGDSLRAFLARTGGSFRRAYALEPDPENRARLVAYVGSLPLPSREAITILPFAAGDSNGVIRFDPGLGVASVAKPSGSIDMPCRRLDDVDIHSPTIIKMDIEGSEPLALRGAATLIHESRPVLAVCAYHYCEHLWELPLLLNTLAPDFSIFLRRYAEQCWETVYYAVPKERRAVSHYFV